MSNLLESLFQAFAFKIAPLLASILISIAYLPQIWKTWRTKNVEGVSLWFWIIINAFLFCMWSNSLSSLIYDHRLGYFITETINWLFALIQLILVIVYRKKNKK